MIPKHLNLEVADNRGAYLVNNGLHAVHRVHIKQY